MRRLGWLYHRLIDALAVCSAGAVLVMLVMVVGDVVSRQTGFGSWQSTIPVVQLVLLYFTVLAAPHLVREGAHLAVDSFVQLLPAGLRRATEIVVFLLCIGACAVVA